jgi:integrase
MMGKFSRFRNKEKLAEYSRGFLKDKRLKDGTVSLYRKVAKRFWSWLREHRWYLPSTVTELDMILEVYVEQLYFHRQPFYWASHLIAALVLSTPALKGRLPRTTQAVSGFRALKKVQSWLPIPKSIVAAVVLHLAWTGMHEAACAIALAYDCYLRIQEVSSLDCADFFLPGDHGFSSTMFPYVNIREAKTGLNQSVTLDCPLVLRLVTLQKAKVRIGPLFPSMSKTRLRHHLATTLEALGVPRGVFVFHGLRHGAAAHDLHTGYRTFAEVQHRGRWRSERCCRIYVARGRTALLTEHLYEGSRRVRRTLRWDHSQVLIGESFSDATLFRL